LRYRVIPTAAKSRVMLARATQVIANRAARMLNGSDERRVKDAREGRR
jgi:hypothetical protein